MLPPLPHLASPRSPETARLEFLSTKNEGALEHAQFMAGHASPRTTKLYDRRKQEATLDEVERIIL